VTKPVLSVCFRVDAHQQLGLGHLSRCRSLMLALARIAKCDFSIISDDQAVVKKFITKIDFDLFAVKHHFAGRPFDLAIVDVPKIARRENERLRELSDLVVCIDDEGPGLPGQDIQIRCTLLDLPKPAGLPLKNYWSGRDYIILHPDFAAQAARPGRRRRRAEKLLVCFGGSDPGGLTLRVAPLLKKLDQPLAVNVVLGPACSGRKKIVSLLKGDPRFLLSCNVPNMARQLGAADLALISGGTLLYEACALGRPAVVISQNVGQLAEAKICRSAGAAASLGINRSVPDDAITDALRRLVVDGALRAKMARQGPRLVSPSGSLKIAAKLLSYVKGAGRS
jgi:UDP-2,4-diacetamido-2,4,6-trideoxy-beta-L-altropyranose hydrolase